MCGAARGNFGAELALNRRVASAKSNRTAKEPAPMTAASSWIVLTYAGLVAASIAALLWMGTDTARVGRRPDGRSDHGRQLP
jgi:hypothetical protein